MAALNPYDMFSNEGIRCRTGQEHGLAPDGLMKKQEDDPSLLVFGSNLVSEYSPHLHSQHLPIHI